MEPTTAVGAESLQDLQDGIKHLHDTIAELENQNRQLVVVVQDEVDQRKEANRQANLWLEDYKRLDSELCKLRAIRIDRKLTKAQRQHLKEAGIKTIRDLQYQAENLRYKGRITCWECFDIIRSLQLQCSCSVDCEA